MGEKGSPEKKPVGIAKNRGCTDIPFLILFIAYWIGMWIVAGVALKSGDPERLIVPTDSLGQYCGKDNAGLASSLGSMDLTTKPYLYIINPIQLSLSKNVCLESCPTITRISTFQDTICFYNVTPPTNNMEFLDSVSAMECSPLIYGGKDLLNRCIPSAKIPEEIIKEALEIINNSSVVGTIDVNAIMGQGRDNMMKMLGDVMNSYIFIIAGSCSAIIVCFIYLLLLRFFAKPMVWITLVLTNILLIGLTVWLYYYWKDTKAIFDALDPTLRTNEMQWQVTGVFAAFIVAAILEGILLIITIFLRSRINIAIQIIKEASKAVTAMPSLAFFPIFNGLLVLALALYFIYIYLYIITPTGAVSVSVQGATWSGEKTSTYFYWFHIFGCLWGWGFLTGINQVTLAGAVASYYWTMDKKHLPRLPIIRAFIKTMWYHLGSIALGSFVLAIVQLMRVALWSFKKQCMLAKKIPFAQYMFACVDCCLKCIENTVKYINKEAYILIAIEGKNFCRSAATAFLLIVKNGLRVAAINFVSAFVLLIAKILITGSVFFATWTAIKWKAEELNITFTLVPALLVAVFAYIISKVFLGVYDMAIDTIFMCFLEDCDKNDGSEDKPYFMSDALQRITNTKNSTKVYPKM